MDRYSFPVRLFHPLLPAGLSRRTLCPYFVYFVKENGIAVATIRHSTHIGRLGEYSERAAEKGFVTMITAGAAGLGVGGMAP